MIKGSRLGRTCPPPPCGEGLGVGGAPIFSQVAPTVLLQKTLVW
jgi:hypothetical protein